MDACEGYVSKESVLDVFAQWHGHDVCDFNRAIKELSSVNPTEQEAYDKGYKQGYADRIEMERALRVEDCISRSDVHDLIATWLSDHLTEGTREVLETIDAKIEDLQPVKPTRAKGEWIPTSEMLPEGAYGCIVTVMDTNPITCDEFENIYPDFVGWDGENWNDADGHSIPFEVIAWMPLPEPYKAESEVQE